MGWKLIRESQANNLIIDLMFDSERKLLRMARKSRSKVIYTFLNDMIIFER